MSRTVAIEDIVILEDRQRQEKDPQAEEDLRKSIEEIGLLHAPVMREYQDSLVLVAGETRIGRMKDIWALGGEVRYDGKVLPIGRIPYVTLGELEPLAAEEAELDENLRRKDLSWQDHAAAVNRLHLLRGKQKVKAAVDAAPAGTVVDVNSIVHTVAETAKELTGRSDGYYQDSTRKEILVAKHLASNPEVAKAKSVDEAFKILKRQEAQKVNAELAATVGATFNSSMHEALHGSCTTLLQESRFQSYFDVICTDPPYGMGADQFGDGAGRLSGIEHHYDDSYPAWQKLMQVWCPLSYAVCKPQAHAYVFCDIDRFHELKSMMQAAGWYVFRTPLIIYKTNSGRVPLPDRGPRRQYEIVLYAIKGEKPVTHIYPDVIPSTADENMSHGAQKPVMVYQNLLQRSIRPGDKVLDSFSGSGTIFPACHTMQCAAVGMEGAQEYYGMGLKRLQDLDIVEALTKE